MVRVVIVSQIRLYGEGLVDFLNRDADILVAGVRTRVDDAVELINKHQPDVVLFDLAHAEALAGAKRLLQTCPGVNVIALAVDEDANAIIACAEAGVCGYVAGDASLSDLRAAIFAAVRGELQCPPRIAHRLLREVGRLAGSTPLPSPETNRLTAREWEILQLIERGFSNDQIAAELHIGTSTVKNHVHNILEKLNVNRRGEAAAIARRSGEWMRERAE